MGDRDLVVKELVYHRQLIPCVERYPTKTAMIDGTYKATYEQHFERVCRLANALGSELGMKRDDRVGILALNSHAFVELYQACFMGAGIINGLNIRLAPKELEFILQDSGSKVVLTDAFFAGVDRADPSQPSGPREGRADRRRGRCARRQVRGPGRRRQHRHPTGDRRVRPGDPQLHGRDHRAAEGRADRPTRRHPAQLPGVPGHQDRQGRDLPEPDADVPRRVGVQRARHRTRSAGRSRRSRRSIRRS